MPDVSDIALLGAWRERRDRDAMQQLVCRHIHFVYGAARRMLGDPLWAEDVAQVVFMLLIQKSPRVPSDAALVVWLHRTTRYACANARRMRLHQCARERRAATAANVESNIMQNGIHQIDDDDERDRLLPLLDEAITQLRPRDRSGVILCYFQRRSFREIAAALGTSEDAARKRVGRAVDRLRDYFASRGVMTASATLGACLLHQSTITAPSALASAAVNIATVSELALTASITPCAQIFHGVLQTMLLAKVKVAAAIVAAALLAGTAGVTIHEVYASTTALSTTFNNAPATFETKASDATTVQFLGVAKWGAANDEWFAIDGTKIDDPRGPFANERLRARSDVTHQAMLHIAGQSLNGGYNVNVSQAKGTFLYDLTPDIDSAYLLVPFSMPDGAATADIELLLAEGEWKNINMTDHRPGVPLGSHETELGGLSYTHISEGEGGGSVLYVAHEAKGLQFEVVAMDGQGTVHRAHNINGGKAGSFFTYRYDFSIAPDQIASVAARVRPFNRKVIAKNVTLDPAKPTKPQIEVTEINENPPEKSK